MNLILVSSPCDDYGLKRVLWDPYYQCCFKDLVITFSGRVDQKAEKNLSVSFKFVMIPFKGLKQQVIVQK